MLARLWSKRRNPIFDACRALLARDTNGRLEAWRRGKAGLDLQLGIERGAGLTVRETESQSLRLVPWRPLANDTRSDAVLYRAGRPLAAISLLGVQNP